MKQGKILFAVLIIVFAGLVSSTWNLNADVTLAVPENTLPGLQKRFNKGHQKWSQQRQERIYIVQPGDNLSTIAEQFRVPLAAILIWNRIDLKSPLYPGDRLIIHKVESRTVNP